MIIREQWSHANELFHNVILAAANCPPLRETVQSLANRVPRSLAWHTFGDDPGIILRSVEDHDRIVELLNAPGRRARPASASRLTWSTPATPWRAGSNATPANAGLRYKGAWHRYFTGGRVRRTAEV